MQNYPIRLLLISTVLLCYPVLLFAIKGGMNALFFLLVALSLLTIFRQRCDHPKYFDASTIAFSAAMLSGMAAIFLSQAWHGDFNMRPYDAASRLLLAVPVFIALRSIGLRSISLLQYGFPLGAVASLIIVLLMHGNYHYSGRASTEFMHPIYFGDLALILGFLSLFSINWLRKDKTAILALKIAGALAGVYVSVLSQSRGGWIAIPVLLGAWLILQNKKRRLIRLSYALPLLLLALLASYFFVDIVHQRIDTIFHDLAAYSNGQADTSVGQRFQLWKAALYLYGQNPLFGVGPEGFAHSMEVLSQSGLITEEAAQLGRGEVHSQILASLVGLGVPGLLSVLSIYFVPFFIFVNAAKSGSDVKRTAGMMGLCLTLGFLVFGLTAELFNIKMIASFYGLTVAALLAGVTCQEDKL